MLTLMIKLYKSSDFPVRGLSWKLNDVEESYFSTNWGRYSNLALKTRLQLMTVCHVSCQPHNLCSMKYQDL
jgi:hypothetical protein